MPCPKSSPEQCGHNPGPDHTPSRKGKRITAKTDVATASDFTTEKLSARIDLEGLTLKGSTFPKGATQHPQTKKAPTGKTRKCF